LTLRKGKIMTTSLIKTLWNAVDRSNEQINLEEVCAGRGKLYTTVQFAGRINSINHDREGHPHIIAIEHYPCTGWDSKNLDLDLRSLPEGRLVSIGTNDSRTVFFQKKISDEIYAISLK
jgi:hypothetical protein